MLQRPELNPRTPEPEPEGRPNASAEFVFDGTCGFCTRFALWLARLDRHGRLHITPWQAPGTLDRAGLSRAQVSSAAWLVADGKTLRAAAAINRALSIASGWNGFEHVYGWPLVGRAQEFAYGWIAAHRHQFRGVKPLCARPGSHCLERNTGDSLKS